MTDLDWPSWLDLLPIPDGTTWTGTVDGATWTTGSGLVFDLPDSPRKILATAFETATGDGVQVYTSPPEVPAPPCIVIRPADPYQAPVHAGGTAIAAWAFEVDIILRRNRADNGLRALERGRELLCAALPAGWRWVEFGDIGEIVIAKKAYLKGTLGVAVTATEGLI